MFEVINEGMGEIVAVAAREGQAQRQAHALEAQTGEVFAVWSVEQARWV